jgi:outer membrane protein assembly factor BamB
VYGGKYAGELFSIDAETGEEEWRVSTIGGSFGRGGGIYSTPAVAFGRVYFGSIDSRVYSVDMDNGDIAWSKSTGAEVYSGPAVADTKGTRATVYIGSADSNVYALDAKTGETRWQANAGGQVTGAGTVLGDVFYVSVIGDGVGTIGYDVENGKVVYEHELGEYNPAITDGQRLYLTGYSEVRAFPHDDGKPSGKGKKKGAKKKAGAKQGGGGQG